MKKTALLVLLTLTLSALTFAADTYLPGKIAKWENGSYPDGKKMKTWVVYSLQTHSTSYQIAHKGENKPQMQAGEAVQYFIKKSNQIYVKNAQGKKREYQIIGQTAAAAPAATPAAQ